MFFTRQKIRKFLKYSFVGCTHACLTLQNSTRWLKGVIKVGPKVTMSHGHCHGMTMTMTIDQKSRFDYIVWLTSDHIILSWSTQNVHQGLNTSEICTSRENSRNEFTPHYVCLFIKLRFVCLTIGYDMVTVRISKKKQYKKFFGTIDRFLVRSRTHSRAVFFYLFPSSSSSSS